MNIAAGLLLKIIPPQKRGKIPGPASLAIVQRQYCGPMTARGFCTNLCSDCKDALLSAFSLENAENEEALLTWRFKSELAKRQEKPGDDPEASKVNLYGLPVSEGNPFERLREQFEKQAQER
jgi:hypothetical protein